MNMRNIYRYIVKNYGDEQTVKTEGKILFINGLFKKSLKIYSLPLRKFKKKIYAGNLDRYDITCVNYPDYSLENVLFYTLLDNLEKYDCFCFGMNGLSFSNIIAIKQFVLQLEKHLYNKMVLIVVKEDEVEENDILSEFPIYR